MLVAVRVSGVNPIDVKTRFRAGPGAASYVPHHDGAGTIVAAGPGVPTGRTGERVWLPSAARQRTEGTARELVALPEKLAVPRPEGASFELGAALGVPALTAHRCLTVGEGGPVRLAPGALAGRSVLVAGGAGAVGNPAVQLARWAGARVVTTVGDGVRAGLAAAAGANADADRAVLAPNGVVACDAGTDEDRFVVPVREAMPGGQRWQGVFLYSSVPRAAEVAGAAAVGAAVGCGALGVGRESGLPVHHFPLERAAAAHEAVLDRSVTGKVLVTVS